MQEIILDALIDTSKMVPLLLIIYIGIELIEYKFGNKIREKVQKIGKTGPIIGAFVGILPQCGFSVTATALYTQRLITIGTLLAVYITTSDEAIPIILAQPDKAKILLPLLLIKVFVALIFGYAIDFIFRRKNKEILLHIKDFDNGVDNKLHNHNSVKEIKACCGHNSNSVTKKFSFKKILFHPVKHTAKIFIFIFGTSLLINVIIFQLGEKAFSQIFLNSSFFQPFLVSLVGLVPNCAASVFITELYLSGAITFGSVVAGLCASGGLGILVLFKEEKNKKDVFMILALLLGISVTVGTILQYVL
jgi:hypothetical protein